MKNKELSLNVESLMLSNEALNQLKLSGIDKLEDFNTFSLKELRMLLANSFEEITPILRSYFLPRVLENLNISKEVIATLNQHDIHDTVELLECDNEKLFQMFESNEIFIQEVNGVLNFFKFVEIVEIKPEEDLKQEGENKTINTLNHIKSDIENVIEIKNNHVQSVFEKFLLTTPSLRQEDEKEEKSNKSFFYRYHLEETIFLSTLLSEGFIDFDTILDMAEDEGLNASVIHYILDNYTVLDQNRRTVFHPLMDVLNTFEVIYEELPLSVYFQAESSLLKSLNINDFKDVRVNIHRLEVIVFVHYHLETMMTYLMTSIKDFEQNLHTHLDAFLDQRAFKNETMKLVFLYRKIESMTLEQVGEIVGLTRERVRQIEAKNFEKVTFDILIPLISLIEVDLKGYLIKSNMIHLDSLKDKYDKKLETVKFLLKLKKYKVIHIKKDSYVIKESKWYVIVERYLESNRENISINEIIDELHSNACSFFEQDILHIMSYNYQFTQSIFELDGKNKRLRYLNIVKKYYPSGMLLYQKEVIQQFKEFFEKEYNIDLDASERSIQGIIQNNCVLSGKGLYIHPEFQKELSSDFYHLLKQYLDKMEYAISIRGLFEVFQTQLSNEYINSSNEFHGLISSYFKEDYNISRSYVFKKPYETFSEVLNVKLNGMIKVCYEELRLEFPSLEEYTLSNFVSSKNYYLPLHNKCFLNLLFVSLDIIVKESIKTFIDSEITSNFISSDVMYTFISKHHPSILLEHEITNTKVLYDYIRYFFRNEYQFKSIFIGKLGDKIPSKIEQVLGLVENHDEIDIQEWIKKQEATGIRIINFYSFLEDIKDEYIRISTYRLVKIELLDITDDDIYKVKDFLLNIVDKNQIFKVNDISLFHRLPKLNYDWSIYLLAEIIEKYIPEITLIKDINNYKNIDFYITIDKYIRNFEDLEKIIN